MQAKVKIEIFICGPLVTEFGKSSRTLAQAHKYFACCFSDRKPDFVTRDTAATRAVGVSTMFVDGFVITSSLPYFRCRFASDLGRRVIYIRV